MKLGTKMKRNNLSNEKNLNIFPWKSKKKNSQMRVAVDLNILMSPCKIRR